MEALEQDLALLSVEDYLKEEEKAEGRSEFIGGRIYAMAGASEEHNLIAGNIFAALRAHLKGGPCKVFMSDMKVRLNLRNEDIFYYPDIMVTCDLSDAHRFYKERPKLLVEVLSEHTSRIDRREKFWSYAEIDTLEEYLMADSRATNAILTRRSTGWNRENFLLPDTVRLDSIGLSLAMKEIYAAVSVQTG